MAHICIAIDKLNCGGAERVAVYLANYFTQVGHSVTVLTLHSGDSYFALNERVNVKCADARNPMRSRTYTWLTRLLNIRKIMSKLDADVTISFAFPTLFLFACLGLGARICISIRNDPNRLPFPDTRWLRRILFKKASCIIAQTHHAKRVIYAQTRHEKIIVIPNPVLILQDSSNRRRAKEIISVGRLIKSKGFDDLIRIFGPLSTSGWKLRIVGDGPEFTNLMNLVNRLDLNGSVYLDGFQTNARTLVASASIFAFCSKSEGFPNALLEAFVAPTCVISYDCVAGPSDFIENDYNGVLVDLENVDQYRHELQSLMLNSKRRARLERNARPSAKRFGLDSIGRQYLDEILNERNSLS